MRHRVVWLLENENVYGKIVCDAPEGAPCREVCAADPPCEEVCVGEDPDTGEEHPMKDSGYCNEREWLTQDSVEVYYAGEPHEAVSGPIVTYWHPDEYMVWTYPGHVHAYRKEFGREHLRCACGAAQPSPTGGDQDE
jgi:hypothetical protein